MRIFAASIDLTSVCGFISQLALLQEEWRGRSLSSQLLTGGALEESSTTDGFQHPRVR